MLSTTLATCRKEAALHLEADSRRTHTSQNMQMYIHTQRESVHTPAWKQTYVCATGSQERTGLFDAKCINKGPILVSFYQQKKVPRPISEKNKGVDCTHFTKPRNTGISHVPKRLWPTWNSYLKMRPLGAGVTSARQEVGAEESCSCPFPHL